MTLARSSSASTRRQERIATWSRMIGQLPSESPGTVSGTANSAAVKGVQMTRHIPPETLSGTVILRVKHKFRQRLVEWGAALEISLLGLILMQNGDSFGNSNSFLWMASLFTEPTWALILISVGVIRLLGLIINGSMESVTPWIRTAGALIGLTVFGMIVTSILYARFWLGAAWSTGLSPYGVGFCMEIAAIVCASADARMYKNGTK